MSWRHGTCKCCGDCTLISIEQTCTLAGDGPCPPTDCDSCVEPCDISSVEFNPPDSVSGRTLIDNIELYPTEELFKWRGGTTLTVIPKVIRRECNGVEFSLIGISVQWGCPGALESVFFPSWRAVIFLPQSCSDCEIRVILRYREVIADDLNCGNCGTNVLTQYPLFAYLSGPQLPNYGPLEPIEGCAFVPLPTNEGQQYGLVLGSQSDLDAILDQTLGALASECHGEHVDSPTRFAPMELTCEDNNSFTLFSNSPNPFEIELDPIYACRGVTACTYVGGDCGFYQRVEAFSATSLAVLVRLTYETAPLAVGTIVGNIMVWALRNHSAVARTVPVIGPDTACDNRGHDGDFNVPIRYPVSGNATLGNFDPTSLSSFCIAAMDAIKDHGPYTVPSQTDGGSIVVTFA